MKGENIIILVLVILLVAVVFYFTGQPEGVEGQENGEENQKECPSICPNPGTWSGCSEEGMKTRTNYGCSEETNYECEAYEEEMACKTEMAISGSNGLEAIITPTLDETVKGIIQVEAVAIPDGTESVVFFFFPGEISLDSDMTEEELEKLVQEIDSDGENGWKVFFDTEEVNDGLYKIVVAATYEGAPEEDPWLGFGYAQVIVKNQN